jgi:hypothetical protein
VRLEWSWGQNLPPTVSSRGDAVCSGVAADQLVCSCCCAVRGPPLRYIFGAASDLRRHLAVRTGARATCMRIGGHMNLRGARNSCCGGGILMIGPSALRYYKHVSAVACNLCLNAVTLCNVQCAVACDRGSWWCGNPEW